MILGMGSIVRQFWPRCKIFPQHFFFFSSWRVWGHLSSVGFLVVLITDSPGFKPHTRQLGNFFIWGKILHPGQNCRTIEPMPIIVVLLEVGFYTTRKPTEQEVTKILARISKSEAFVGSAHSAETIKRKARERSSWRAWEALAGQELLPRPQSGSD